MTATRIVCLLLAMSATAAADAEFAAFAGDEADGLRSAAPSQYRPESSDEDLLLQDNEVPSREG